MSLLTTSTGTGGIQPDDFADLVVQPVQRLSVAYQSMQLIQNDNTNTQIPVVVSDPAAGWFAEAATITAEDAVLDTITATPKKVAGYTLVSNEMVNGSQPQALDIVGDGLARQIVEKIDTALFGDTTSNGPAGLLSLDDASIVDNGGSFADFDPFAAAISECEQNGGLVRAFLMSPATALTLAQLKQSTDSNLPLLGSNATDSLERRILGIPVLVSPHCPDADVWAMPDTSAYVVQSGTAELESDSSVAFQSYQTAVRAVMRVDFAFAHEARVVRITDANAS